VKWQILALSTSNASVNGHSLLKVKEGIDLKPEAYTSYVEDFKNIPDAEIEQNRSVHRCIDGA